MNRSFSISLCKIVSSKRFPLCRRENHEFTWQNLRRVPVLDFASRLAIVGAPAQAICQKRMNSTADSGSKAIRLSDLNFEIDALNRKFAEARQEIEMAMDSKETLYFDEEADSARSLAKEVLDMFELLLEKVADDDKAYLRKSMALKMEQLKGEIKQLDDPQAV